ncbi:MAG: serine/threonine protein kinase [Deltaproteobacteria bacterium]|nr:serine/threonine protein kinase [Deltaproteobacteria bacterium]
MANSYERFGKYILLEKLASGGMAEVYLSKHTGAIGVSKFVAIKRILPQYSDNEEFIEMFKEEAKIAVNLNHSNVVHIHEFGIEKNQFFLVMEYVEGRNLRQIINELKKRANHFQIDQVAYIIKEVAAGLDHAHRCLDGTTGKPLNITHRDMSPQNIMISFEGQVKIIDFGIAKAENQLESTKTGTLKGKFGYMSPEQADGQHIDLRTDVFSLGIVFWELLAKDRLFSGNNEASILRKIRECAIPSLRKIDPAIHPDLEKIVNKALAKDKNLRYQTSAALHRDLNKFLNTHYPEFSPQDFSVFIKHTFADSFSEQKGKLVEFSSVQIPEEEGTEKSVTKVNEKYQIRLNSAAEELHRLPAPEAVRLEKVNDFISEEDKLEIPEITSKMGHSKPAHNQIEESAIFHKTINTKSFAKNTFGNKTKKVNLKDSKNKRQNRLTGFEPKVKENSFSSFFIVLLLVLISGGGFIYLKKPTLITDFFVSVDPQTCSTQKNNSKCIEKCLAGNKSYCFANASTTTKPKNPPIAKKPEETNVINQSSNDPIQHSSATEKYSIYVDTHPPLAEVYIDDIKQTGYTPMMVEVPAKRSFKFKLFKEDYDPIEKKLYVTHKGFNIKETLTEMKYGYIIINSPNAGTQYNISINKISKPEYVLRQLIKVPALTKLKVEVVNSLGFVATQDLLVKENTKQAIEIILKKAE